MTENAAQATSQAANAGRGGQAASAQPFIDDATIVWQCPACGTEGRISNWQGTFWDLSSGKPAD